MPEPEPATPLSVELEAALLRELRAAFELLNYSHFKERLRPPTMALGQASSRLGQWQRELRTIELGRALLIGAPWGSVIEVLKHEMAHQYVDEVLGRGDETAHGPAFRELCARLGIDGRASGVPPSEAPSSDEGLRVLSRIAKLLALAESANVHEAESAMSEAQRLMLRHNLEGVRTGQRLGYGFRHLGAPSGRVSEAERIVGSILCNHFFVEAIWVPVWRVREGRRGTILEVCGTAVNLEMAAYVHGFLLETAERLWRDYKRQRRLDSNRDRRTYLAGVMEGFREKLEAQRTEQVAAGLIWVGDGDLRRFYRQRHPRICHTRHVGNRRTAARADGRATGRRLVLHRPVAGASSGEVRRLPAHRD